MQTKTYRRLKYKVTMLGVLLLAAVSFVSTNAYADTENPLSGFNTQGFTLSDDGAKDMLSIAEKQLGKTGEELGYSENWSIQFIVDCAQLAKQTYAIPGNWKDCRKSEYESDVWVFLRSIYQAGASAVTNPQPGDLVVYKDKNRVGIMVSQTRFIEGDFNGSVSKVRFGEYFL